MNLEINHRHYQPGFPIFVYRHSQHPAGSVPLFPWPESQDPAQALRAAAGQSTFHACVGVESPTRPL